MKSHNGSKPKAEWKPPPGYKNAIAKTRDATEAKLAAAKKKSGSMNFVTESEGENHCDDDDTAYEDGCSQAGRSFSIQALQPYQPVTRGSSWPAAQTNAIKVPSSDDCNPFRELNDAQDYD